MPVKKKKVRPAKEMSGKELVKRVEKWVANEGTLINEDVFDELLARYKRAAALYDLVVEDTESLEVNHVGAALAYMIGAILKGKKVDIRGGLGDPHMGALYAILVMHYPDNDPIWNHVIFLEING